MGTRKAMRQRAKEAHNKAVQNLAAIERLDTPSDGWIGYIIRDGVCSIILNRARFLLRAMKDIELKFSNTSWPLFVDIETHEEMRFLEGSVVEYDSEGVPHERFIELVRENYVSGRELSARVSL